MSSAEVVTHYVDADVSRHLFKTIVRCVGGNNGKSFKLLCARTSMMDATGTALAQAVHNNASLQSLSFSARAQA